MLLEMREVSKKYKRNEREFWAVEDFNLEMDKGEFVAVCGASGSGKSTLFHMLAGLLKPDKGQIVFQGEDICAKNTTEMAKYRNLEIGYVLQGQSVLKNYTVLENICLPFYISGSKGEVYEWGMELLKKTGLVQCANSYPEQLSGGEIRRTAIARALINKPKLILADEPTSNLDKENAIYVLELLNQVRQDGVGVMISTHDEWYQAYADKIIKINHGRIVETECDTQKGNCYETVR